MNRITLNRIEIVSNCIVIGVNRITSLVPIHSANSERMDTNSSVLNLLRGCRVVIIPLSELHLHTHNKKYIFFYKHESYTVLRQWQSEIQSLPRGVPHGSSVGAMVLSVLNADLRKYHYTLTYLKNYFWRDQNRSNITFYYQSGKYVFCQLHCQFKDVKSYQYKTSNSQD